jgi:hypothetical protein
LLRVAVSSSSSFYSSLIFPRLSSVSPSLHFILFLALQVKDLWHSNANFTNQAGLAISLDSRLWRVVVWVCLYANLYYFFQCFPFLNHRVGQGDNFALLDFI